MRSVVLDSVWAGRSCLPLLHLPAQLLPHHHNTKPHSTPHPSCLLVFIILHIIPFFLPVCIFPRAYFSLFLGSFLINLSPLCVQSGGKAERVGAFITHIYKIDILHHALHIGSFTHSLSSLLRSSPSQAEGIFITEMLIIFFLYTHTHRERPVRGEARFAQTMLLF